MRTCYKCKDSEPTVEFKRIDNICTGCFKEYQRQYRERNKTRLASGNNEWRKANKPNIRKRNRERHATLTIEERRKGVSKTPRVFLAAQLSRFRHQLKKRKSLHAKHDFDLDLDYLMAMWHQQQGKCALTGLPMNHTPRDLSSVSIDRKDSSLGHVRGNVQLVCMCMNMAKGDHANEELLRILDNYVELRTLRS